MTTSPLELVLDLVRVRRSLASSIDEALSVHHGLSLSDLAILLELESSADQRLRRTELARRLGVTPSGVARQVAPLERIGLVGRESTRDARLALVTLTSAGERLARTARATAEEAATNALARLWDARAQGDLAALLAYGRRAAA